MIHRFLLGLLVCIALAIVCVVSHPISSPSTDVNTNKRVWDLLVNNLEENMHQLPSLSKMAPKSVYHFLDQHFSAKFSQINKLENEQVQVEARCATAVDDDTNEPSGNSLSYFAKQISNGQEYEIQMEDVASHLEESLFFSNQGSIQLMIKKGFVFPQQRILLLDSQSIQLSIKKQPPTSQQETHQSSKIARRRGPQRILWIRLSFPDATGDPNTATQIQQYGADLDVWLREISYNTMWVQSIDIPNTVQSATTLATYNTNAQPDPIHTDATTLATQAGFNCYNSANPYDFCIVSFVRMTSFSWDGLGTIGGPKTWLNLKNVNYLSNFVNHHELGHNSGFWHANRLGGATVPFGSSNTHTEYGDSFDVMGRGNTVLQHQHNPKNRLIAGWMTLANDTLTLKTPFDGPLTLTSFDQIVSKGKGIMALFSPWRNDFTNANYMFSYRSRAISNARYNVGALGLHSVYNFYTSSNSTHLLDTTPLTTADTSDSMIVVGQTFFDSTTNPPLRLSVLSAQCNKSDIDNTPCKLQLYVHYGAPVVTESLNVNVKPLHVSIFDPNLHKVRTNVQLRFVTNINSVNNDWISYATTGNSFKSQSSFFSYASSSTTTGSYSMTVSNKKGSTTTSQATITMQSTATAVGTVFCDMSTLRTNATGIYITVTARVQTGPANRIWLTQNEELLINGASQISSQPVVVDLKQHSGMHTFMTYALDSNQVLDASSVRFSYVNVLEGAIQLQRTQDTTLRAKFLIPPSGSVLYRKVAITNGIMSMFANQHSAQYSSEHRFHLKVTGQGSVNILFPYDVTVDTVVEMEIKSTQAGSAHFVSLQKSLQTVSEDFIFILGTDRQNYDTEYSKATFGNVYTTVRIPLGKIYLKDKDLFSGLYLTFTNLDNSAMEIQHIRFYENEATVNTIITDTTVKNSIVKFHQIPLNVVWSVKAPGQSSFSPIPNTNNNLIVDISTPQVAGGQFYQVNLVVSAQSNNNVYVNQTWDVDVAAADVISNAPHIKMGFSLLLVLLSVLFM